MHIIDQPRFVARDKYDTLIEKLARTLDDHEAVRSVYQIGSVRHPGISDLDLVCIFQGDEPVKINVRQGLNEDELYILTHDLFGIHEAKLRDSFRFSFYTGYRLVSGDALDIPENPTALIHHDLTRQIALEFMLKMYISMYTQITYRTIKLRAFLLEAKAIAFDLELLGITSNPLLDLVHEVNQWRDHWFDQKPTNNEVIRLFKSFFLSLEKVLSKEVTGNTFYLPYAQTAISKNIMIGSGKTFKMRHSGMPLLSYLPFMNRKLMNLQNRFNQFYLEAPYVADFGDSVHEKRFLLYEQMWSDNKQHYPHFIPSTTGIRLWRPEDFK